MEHQSLSDYYTKSEVEQIIESILGVPSAFATLNYIQSNGTQWIDTGYYPRSDNIVYECEWVEPVLVSTQSIFGSTDLANPNGKWSSSHFHPAAGQFYAATGNSDRICQVSGLTAGTKNVLRTSINSGLITLTLNGTSVSTNYSGSVSNGVNISLFGNRQSGGNITELCSMQLYTWRMYDNGTLVRDMVPVRRISDGVLGMFDKAGRMFYVNSGTGIFTAG